MKLTQEQANKNVNDRCLLLNYKYKPFIYTTANKCYLELTCDKDHTWNTTTYNNFINQNKKCPTCGGSKLITQEQAELNVKNKCKELNITCGDFIYTNCDTYLPLMCKHGHTWKTSTYNSFIHKNINCPVCYGNNKTTQEQAEINIHKICEQINYSYKPFIYISTHKTYLELTCDNGHTWNTTNYSKFLSGIRCPICNSSKLEQIIRKLLDKYNINYKSKYNFKELNRQYLDFYLYDYNIAIECQGDQHFTPVDFGGLGEKWAKNLYEKTITRDKLKYDICKEHGIKILYFTNYKNIPDDYLDLIYTDEQKIIEMLNVNTK